jgi:DNA-binding transcriptional regulator PaaX
MSRERREVLNVMKDLAAGHQDWTSTGDLCHLTGRTGPWQPQAMRVLLRKMQAAGLVISGKRGAKRYWSLLP